MKLLKYLLFGGSSSIIGYATYSTAKQQDGTFDPYNIGAARFGRAAATVAAIGIDYKMNLFTKRAEALYQEQPGEYAELRSQVHSRSAMKLLKLCQNNGGCFVKVGQHIAALDYLLPEEYVTTMKKLRADAPEMGIEDVFQVIREDLKAEPLQLFSEFHEQPLGVASLAQVHKARLRASGEVVAVKVQHRYVRNHSFVDIYTMDVLVRAIKYIFPEFEFMWLADEMRKNLPMELRFTQEGQNAEKVAGLLSYLPWLRVPQIHWELTSDRVLTMEFCQGGFVDDVEYMKRHNINLVGVSKKISRMYADMIYKFGYVHCDPHAGNILVHKNGSVDEIVLLDHGLYSQLTNEFRTNFSKFMWSVDNADVVGMEDSAGKMNVGSHYKLLACMITGRAWPSIEKGIYRTARSESEVEFVKRNASKYLKQIVEVFATVNKEMILIFKTIDLLRNISSTLGTQRSMIHQYEIAKAMLTCLARDRAKQCGWRRLCLFRAWCFNWLGQLYLWLWWSWPACSARRLLGFGYV